MIVVRYIRHCLAWWAWAMSKPKHALPHALVRDVYWEHTRKIWNDYYAREPRWEG